MNPSASVFPIKARLIMIWVSMIVLAAWAFCETFIIGTTDGPDFVQLLKSGAVSAGSVVSIEVVDPPVGHGAFKASEYDGLVRRAKITDAAAISRLLELVKNVHPERTALNHPVTTHRVYLKVNGRDEFFWLYLEALKDFKVSVLDVRANTRDALNPNGASSYYLRDYAEVLSLLGYSKAPVND